jgi:general secretion pathway protein M
VNQRLGTNGRNTVAADSATVKQSGASPDALAQWLQQSRASARALPGEAHLTRGPNGMWDGTLVVALPPRS